MVVRFSIDFNATGPMFLFGTILPAQSPAALKKGAARAALRVQDLMRQELDRLIYSTPESPTYKRTHTLYRSTYAARPGANHSSDHEAAKAGIDLALHDPGGGGGFVVLRGFEVEAEIGAWANYAYFVHEGMGQGARVPKPFAVRPAAEAPRILAEEINSALAELLASVIR